MSNLILGSVYDTEDNNSNSLRGDFIGFTINGIHSSELGIIRTSGGSRFEEALLPSSNIRSTNLQGRDGALYFGKEYTQRVININIAYDHLTQENFNRLTRVLGEKGVVPLIFDESPYKIYNVVISSEPRLTYICFDEENQRIYKGEGNIQFTCFSPFAKGIYNFIEEIEEQPKNISEWIGSSGIISNPNGERYNKFSSTSSIIKLWNGGQLDTDFNLYISFNGAEGEEKINSFNINLGDDSLFLREIVKEKPEDVKIKINTRTNLIEGINIGDATTGSIYNKYIQKGTFFKIPIGEQILKLDADTNSFKDEDVSIEYSYLYY